MFLGRAQPRTSHSQKTQYWASPNTAFPHGCRSTALVRHCGTLQLPPAQRHAPPGADVSSIAFAGRFRVTLACAPPAAAGSLSSIADAGRVRLCLKRAPTAASVAGDRPSSPAPLAATQPAALGGTVPAPLLGEPPWDGSFHDTVRALDSCSANSPGVE